MKSKQKLYLFSLIFLSLVLLCSLLYALHLRGKVAGLEKQISESPAYTKTPAVSMNSDLSQNNLPSEYKQAIREFIDQNIEKIVNEEHMGGGRWILTNLKFLSPRQIQIDFEDGHTTGQIILVIDDLKITDVKYRTSWQ